MLKKSFKSDGIKVRDIVGSQEGLDEGRCWAVELNGKLIPYNEVETVRLTNAAMGLSVHYGRVHDAPYAQAVVEKPGGSTIIPICIHPQAGVLIGVVSQGRPLQNRSEPGTPIWNVPRGFRLPEEAFSGAAATELMEELGGLVGRIVPASGCGVHMDNALATYSTGSCGDYFFHVTVSPDEVHQQDGEWKFVDGIIEEPTPSDEKILGCTFITVSQVMAEVEDAYTRLALLSALYDLGRIQS